MKTHVLFTVAIALCTTSMMLQADYGDVAKFKRECFASGGERIGWRDGSLVCVGGNMGVIKTDPKPRTPPKKTNIKNSYKSKLKHTK